MQPLLGALTVAALVATAVAGGPRRRARHPRVVAGIVAALWIAATGVAVAGDARGLTIGALAFAGVAWSAEAVLEVLERR